MTRYQIGPKSHDAAEVRDPADGATLATVEVGDLLDTRTGTTYAEGWHRVQLTPAGRERTGMRTKTFRGETAWSDAERYARDLAAVAHRSYLSGSGPHAHQPGSRLGADVRSAYAQPLAGYR